jgi:hypothetical protein
MRGFALSMMALIAVATGCGSSASAASTPLREDTVFEFVGRVDQADLQVNSYGYLTHIPGLNEADLFTASFPAWSESTAKFTFVTTSTLTSRFALPNVFSIAGNGTTTYYYTTTPTGNFADPATSGRYVDVNSVYGAGLGIINGSGEVTQSSATPVTVNGAPFTLGSSGLSMRVSYSGQATRTSPTANNSISYLAGQARTIR